MPVLSNKCAFYCYGWKTELQVAFFASRFRVLLTFVTLGGLLATFQLTVSHKIKTIVFVPNSFSKSFKNEPPSLCVLFSKSFFVAKNLVFKSWLGKCIEDTSLRMNIFANFHLHSWSDSSAMIV